ncbi:Bug family tripartite tricarboxylate transporter substrate binding protein [Variovorax sp. LT1R16]|uniref:Bug family tripartite tricarboxylate transporter substrate binding protein n=1 Tax=Variovorax sp. LT1R16 TaxID=3443728 RepID=UPI003F47BA73
MKSRFTLFAAAAAALLSAGTQAADYPSQAIRLVVPYPPGGPVDFVARTLSAPLSQELGQSIIIDNKGGAGGNIAAAEVARAKPDGYTLMLVYETHATTNLFYRNFKFDSFQSFDYISLIGQSPMVLLTSKQSGLDSLPKLAAALRDKPGQLNQAITGPGDASVLKPELLHQVLKTKVTYVPFPGTAPALTSLAGGQIDLGLVSVTAALPLVQGGKVNAIGVGFAGPIAALPGVPSINTIAPGFESAAWVGIVAPKDLPPAVMAKLEASIQKVLMAPSVRKQLEASSFVILGNNQRSFVERARADYREAQALIANGVLKPEE